MKPIRLNLSSPWEARATPIDIIKTIMASLLFGSWIRNVQDMRRIATGVNAYDRENAARRGEQHINYLEHLDVGDAKVQISSIAED